MSTERLSDDDVARLIRPTSNPTVLALACEVRDLRAETARQRTLLRALVDIDEYPCAGSCLGCGAGPDEECTPPCRSEQDCELAATLDAALEGDDTDG